MSGMSTMKSLSSSARQNRHQRLVTMKAAARMASSSQRFAAPRPDIKPPASAAATSDSQTTALATLHQHHADQRQNDQEMDNQENLHHGGTAFALLQVHQARRPGWWAGDAADNCWALRCQEYSLGPAQSRYWHRQWPKVLRLQARPPTRHHPHPATPTALPHSMV